MGEDIFKLSIQSVNDNLSEYLNFRTDESQILIDRDKMSIF